MMDSPDSRSEERTGPSEVAGSTGTTSPASGVDTPGSGSEGARIGACPTCGSNDPAACWVRVGPTYGSTGHIRWYFTDEEVGKYADIATEGYDHYRCFDPFHSPSDKGVEERWTVGLASQPFNNERRYGGIRFDVELFGKQPPAFESELVPATASDQRAEKALTTIFGILNNTRLSHSHARSQAKLIARSTLRDSSE